MTATRTKIVCAAFLLFAVGAAGVPVTQVSRIPATADETQRSSDDDTRVKMQAKLLHSQQVLRGLVLQDFEIIEEAAGALKTISLSPVPRFERTGDRTEEEEVYEHFRMEFARLAGRLESHARAGNVDATSYVYQNLMDSCIACHDYIRDYEE